MLLLVVFALVLRLINGSSDSSDEECGSAVTTSSNYFQSSQELASSESARCHICGLCFKNFAVHMSVHNHQKPFKCSQCGKQFTLASSLQSHQQMHSGEKLHHCTICGKQFTRLGSLRKHQQLHIDVKSFRCAECGKQFAYAHRLQTHQRTHTGEKPFTCSDCGKQFARADMLQNHQRSHIGEKPFRCTECGKCFPYPNNLLRHHRTHSSVDRFRTTQCDVYSDQRTHTGGKPFERLQCRMQFERADNLNEQEQKNHAVLKNSTYSSSLGYSGASVIVESATLFQSIFRNSLDSSPVVQLEDLTVRSYPSVIQTADENFDDSSSFALIKSLTGMKNLPLEIRVDGISPVEMEVSAAMEDPYPLHPVLENSIANPSLTPTDIPHRPENPTVLQPEYPMDYPSLSENPMESRSFEELQNRVIFNDPYLLPVDNPSLVQKKEYTVLQKLISSPSLIRADTYGDPETPINSTLFVRIEEHILMNAKDRVPDVQLPSGGSVAALGSTYWECPVCFGRFGDRSFLEDHMLNSSCSLFPIHWQPDLESGDNSDFAK